MTSAKLLEGFSGGLADRWLGTLFTPAFVFWLGGGLAALQKIGWQAFEDFFSRLPGYQLKPGQVDRTRDWAVVTKKTV